MAEIKDGSERAGSFSLAPFRRQNVPHSSSFVTALICSPPSSHLYLICACNFLHTLTIHAPHPSTPVSLSPVCLSICPLDPIMHVCLSLLLCLSAAGV